MIRILLLVLFIAGCKREATSDKYPNKYFMSASINGSLWKVSNPGQAYFGAHYDNNKQRYFINIGSEDQNPNSICRSIAISFDFVPKVGRYYFNNIGSAQADSGIMASYSYKKINIISSKWSTGGYVDIEEIRRENIKGKFSFTAKGDSTDSTTISITSGSFFVINVGGNGPPWPGP